MVKYGPVEPVSGVRFSHTALKTMETVKGFRDYTGDEAQKRAKIKSIIETTFQLYNFNPIESPIIEYEEFVIGNNEQDEAVSDRYKLEDKGKRKLALRYEFTFQLKRLAQNKKLPYRVYQIGPVFRDEPVSLNRLRQITQCDADIIGSSIKDEAEILKLFSDILKQLNIQFEIFINNRKLLNEILNELKIKPEYLQQVIREIDKLDKLSESEVKENLKKYNAEKSLEIFKKPESYFEKYSSYQEIKALKKQCSNYKILVKFSPFLARGLSYYNGSVYEIKTKKIKETICGGGSYLVNNIQATGLSASIERLSTLANIKLDIKKILIISLDQDKKAIEISNELRKNNISCNILFGNPSKSLDYANSYNIPYVILIGKEELKKKKLKLKDMKTGKEKLLNIKQLIKILK